jgi:hypothetical protein
MQNFPVTSHDVHRQKQIYGMDLGSLKGKTKAKPPSIVNIEYVPRPMVSALIYHMDIMFIDRDPYLVSVTTPLGLLMVNHMGSKSAEAIRKALMIQIGIYKSENFTIETILTDCEAAVVHPLTPELNAMGIKVSPAGPGQHVPVIENKIRQLKERVRAHTAMLPFTLAASLMVWLVAFCVSRLNMMPSSLRMDAVCPKEAFTGRKLDFKKDVPFGFGDYEQMRVNNITNKNSTSIPRTVGVIGLAFNKYLSLDTLRVQTH